MYWSHPEAAATCACFLIMSLPAIYFCADWQTESWAHAERSNVSIINSLLRVMSHPMTCLSCAHPPLDYSKLCMLLACCCFFFNGLHQYKWTCQLIFLCLWTTINCQNLTLLLSAALRIFCSLSKSKLGAKSPLFILSIMTARPYLLIYINDLRLFCCIGWNRPKNRSIEEPILERKCIQLFSEHSLATASGRQPNVHTCVVNLPRRNLQPHSRDKEWRNNNKV